MASLVGFKLIKKFEHKDEDKKSEPTQEIEKTTQP